MCGLLITDEKVPALDDVGHPFVGVETALKLIHAATPAHHFARHLPDVLWF